jgi:hypothetical protein
MGVWMSIVRVIASDGSRARQNAQVGLTALNGATPAGGPAGVIGSAGYREECGPDTRVPQRVFMNFQAVTVGSPTPMTFSRRESAVKANSFISWLV